MVIIHASRAFTSLHCKPNLVVMLFSKSRLNKMRGNSTSISKCMYQLHFFCNTCIHFSVVGLRYIHVIKI